jgi:U3 small nucleolar RNA-associated protein 10
MSLLHHVFDNANIKDLRDQLSDINDFCITLLNFRCGNNYEKLNLSEINAIETNILRALVTMVLKLSENNFRHLFENITQWTFKEESSDANRQITYFRFTAEASNALKSLFLIFTSNFIDQVGTSLDKCNKSKYQNESDLHFENDTNRNMLLAESILRTINNILMHGQQNFVNTHIFNLIMQSIVDQIENPDIIEYDGMEELTRNTISNLAVAANDDVMWKQLNYQILLKTRVDEPSIRIFGLKVCVDVAKRLSDNFESLIPETIPFLSELMEDDNHEVVQFCQQSVRELESTLGESLQRFF